MLKLLSTRESKQEQSVSRETLPEQHYSSFLPPPVIEALALACAGASHRTRAAAWSKAEKAWANAVRGGGATEDYAKRLASEVHAGDGAYILDDDGVVML